MIINNLEIIKKHVSTITDDSIGFAEIEEHVRAAESWLKNDLAGNELFAFVEEHKDDADQKTLIDKVQRVIALDAFARAVPMLNLVLTSAGFAVTNNEKVAPASKERVADLRESLHKQCADAIEDLIIYLEENEVGILWKTAPSYSFITDSFLPTFLLFKNYAAYSEAVAAVYPKCRFDFAKLRGKMRTVMASKIAGAIGNKLVAKILDQQRSNNFSDATMKIIEPLRFALAAYTLGQNDDGDAFINNVMSIIKDNLADFPDCNIDFGEKEWSNKPIFSMC
jgi:hypothetical protein